MKNILLLLALAGACIRVPGTAKAAAPEPTAIYATGFEASEGYDDGFDLVGQKNWVAFGTGGNGLVSNSFAGLGWQAYIGFTPPQGSNDFFNLLQPLNFVPDTNSTPVVSFSVLMAVVPSTTDRRDDFRWSVYNTNGARLFTLDFDTSLGQVNYALDDGVGFIATATTFQPNLIYQLELTLDFGHNAWRAALDGEVVVNARPLTTAAAALNLGDIDAVWAVRTPGAAGDNYLVFDNYVVVSEGVPAMPPILQAIGRLTSGEFLLRLYGLPKTGYAVESSADLNHWELVKAVSAADGISEARDSGAVGQGARFYRARQTSP